MKLLVEVDVLETHESSYRLRIKSGYGDPVMLVHKNHARLVDADEVVKLNNPDECANCSVNIHARDVLCKFHEGD